MFQATRTFVSNLNVKMAQRFVNNNIKHGNKKSSQVIFLIKRADLNKYFFSLLLGFLI